MPNSGGWSSGFCKRGHDITNPENVGNRRDGTRTWCIMCADQRSAERRKNLVRPWDGDECDFGHDISKQSQSVIRMLDGTPTLVCRTCAATGRAPRMREALAHLGGDYEPVDDWLFRTENGPACSGAEFAVFFSGVKQARRPANIYCAHCPVLASCGKYADDRKLDGLWGGVYRTPNGAGGGFRKSKLISHPERWSA